MKTENPEREKQLLTIGANIRRGRHLRKMSQMDLASEARLEISTLHRIESGRTEPGVLTLVKLKNALRLPWGDFLKE